MLKSDLADALGVSASMITKLERRGMPTDSVAAARAWRERNLETIRTKSYRAGGNDGGAARRQRAADAEADAAAEATLRTVETLGRLGLHLLRAGQFATVESDLRAALARVPLQHRDRITFTGDREVLQRHLGRDDPALLQHLLEGPSPGHVPFPLAVWDELVAPVLDAVRAEQARMPEVLPMSEADVDDMAAFWYAAATGEVVLGDAPG